jgi:hypothetical protein
VINDAGDHIHKKLSRELQDLRKLLLIYRILNYDKPLPDVTISLKNRDKQLCKPLIRLFQNSKAIHDILNCLTKFISEKRKKKLDSLDSVLYSIVSDLAKSSNGYTISNEELWAIICTFPGKLVPNKPQCYQTDEFGLVSKTRLSKVCEDKFGAIRVHDGKQRAMKFDKDILSRFHDNYSPIKTIEVIHSQGPNANNTFNAFWNNLEKKNHGCRKTIGMQTTKTNQESRIDDELGNNASEIHESKPINSPESKGMDLDRVLEPLKVLDSQKTKNKKVSKSDYLLYFNSRKESLDGQIHNNFENNPAIGYKKPFYYCKEHSDIQNIHYEEIVDHLKFSSLHKISNNQSGESYRYTK